MSYIYARKKNQTTDINLRFFPAMAKREVPLGRISATQPLTEKDKLHMDAEVQQVRLFIVNQFKQVGGHVVVDAPMAKCFTFRVTYKANTIPFSLKEKVIEKYHPHLELLQDSANGCDIFKLEKHAESDCKILDEVNDNARALRIERERRASKFNKVWIKIVQVVLIAIVIFVIFCLQKLVKPNKY